MATPCPDNVFIATTKQNRAGVHVDERLNRRIQRKRKEQNNRSARGENLDRWGTALASEKFNWWLQRNKSELGTCFATREKKNTLVF
jgi:hypothetical protein